MSKTLRIHYMVADDAGPIHSGPAGTTFKVGTVGTWRAACDGRIVMGEYDRCTTEPWAVRCAACFKTAEFLRDNRPKPGREGSGDKTVAPEDMAIPEPCC